MDKFYNQQKKALDIHQFDLLGICSGYFYICRIVLHRLYIYAEKIS